jgi:hypothetical protein
MSRFSAVPAVHRQCPRRQAAAPLFPPRLGEPPLRLAVRTFDVIDVRGPSELAVVSKNVLQSVGHKVPP